MPSNPGMEAMSAHQAKLNNKLSMSPSVRNRMISFIHRATTLRAEMNISQMPLAHFKKNPATAAGNSVRV